MRRYYKITPSYEKNNTLLRFLHSCQKAEEASEDYAKKFGAVAFHTHPVALAGGIAYLEFDKEPDLRTWRKVAVLDGHDCYEPNTIEVEGVIVAKSKFRPSDTRHRVYSKLPRTWNQVRPLKTLQEWAKMIGYTMTDDQEADAKFVHEQLKDCKFWHFIEFAGLGISSECKTQNSKQQMPIYVRKAVNASVLAQKLPVIFPDSLYNIIGVQLETPETSETPESSEPSTPQFFYWESRGEWYVALDYEVNSEDSEPIVERAFIFAMNTALREAHIQRETIC